MGNRKIEVLDYNPDWPDLCEQEKHNLTVALEPLVSNIEHIGSTSVAGLPAKTIIDILIEVAEIEQLDYRRSIYSSGLRSERRK